MPRNHFIHDLFDTNAKITEINNVYTEKKNHYILLSGLLKIATTRIFIYWR